MSEVISALTMSLDGCIAAAHDDPELPLGVGGEPYLYPSVAVLIG